MPILKLLHTYESRGWAQTVSISPNGMRLLIAGEWDKIRIYDVESNEQVLELSGIPPESSEFNHDGTKLLITRKHCSPVIFDLPRESSEIFQARRVSAYQAINAHFSYDGNKVGVVDCYNVVRIFYDGSEEILRLDHLPYHSFDVAFHPEGDKCAVLNWSGGVTLVNLLTREQECLISRKSSYDSPSKLQFSDDGRKLLVLTGNQHLRVFDLISRRTLTLPIAPADVISDALINADGSLLVAMINGIEFALFETDSLKRIATYGFNNMTHRLSATSDWKRLVTFTQIGDKVNVWELRL